MLVDKKVCAHTGEIISNKRMVLYGLLIRWILIEWMIVNVSLAHYWCDFMRSCHFPVKYYAELSRYFLKVQAEHKFCENFGGGT